MTNTHNDTTNSAQDVGGDAIPMPPRKLLLRFGIPLFLILVAIVLVAVSSWQAFMPATKVEASIVAVRAIETNEPVQAQGGNIVQAPGWVEPDPFSIYVSALTEGVVSEVLVVEGDQISKGQVVATLVDDDARIALRSAEALRTQRMGEVAAAEASLDAARTERTELVSAHRRAAIAKAKAAQLVAQIAGFPARKAQAIAARDQLADEYQRKKKLVEDGAVAAGPVERLGMKVDAAEAVLQSIDADLAAVEAELEAARAEEVAANRDRELLIHETLELERAKANLAIAEGALQSATAMRDEAQLALDRTQVTSPVNGVVIERLTSPGSTIQFGNGTHGAHVIHLYNPEELQVRADIPLAEAARVGVGQAAEIVVDLLPDTIFKGEVTRFVHRADIAKNTVEAKVRIVDPSPLLKPDMLARVRILPGSAKTGPSAMRTVDRVFVPNEAINTDGETWVIEGRSLDQGTVRRTQLLLGEREIDGWREVIEGLEPGDQVVLGNPPLHEGQRVQQRERSRS